MDVIAWLGGALAVTYVVGVISAVDAILNARTAQGATAWVLALLLIPFLALPFYRVFGRSKFAAYRATMEDFDSTSHEAGVSDIFANHRVDHVPPSDDRERQESRAFEQIARMPFLSGNAIRLLVDGRTTFDAMFHAIEQADSYVLVQFYIIRDDTIGRQLRSALLNAAKRNITVYLLYDDVGSHGLGSDYLEPLTEGGVHVSSFGGGRSLLKRFRLNFRNHRKIVVIDGHWGFLGGLNVGDEYLGDGEMFDQWRDTHSEIRGPVVLELQRSFLRDWYYARHELLDVDWTGTFEATDQHALIATTGPADEVETCGLLFTHAIESAEQRVWIASPYFIPDGRIMGALQLAALRGCDVRIMMPRRSDSVYFKFVPFAYLQDVERVGVNVYLYEPGFMHQKVMLIDNDYAAVGTANLDSRSFLLNFESTCLVRDAKFCREMEAMLIRDFESSSELTLEELNGHGWWFRLAVQTTRLLAPVL